MPSRCTLSFTLWRRAYFTLVILPELMAILLVSALAQQKTSGTGLIEPGVGSLWAQSPPAPRRAEAPHDRQQKEGPRLLELNKPVVRELNGGETHVYELRVQAGQFVHAVVDQRGIDVKVILYGPDAKPIIASDRLNGAYGPEPISAVAETSGSYRLAVQSLEKDTPPGRYQVELTALRVPSIHDLTRLKAERAYMKGMEFWPAKGADSAKAAIAQWEQALPLWRTVGDSYEESLTLESIGSVYSDLGEKHKALEYYGQAMPMKHALGDRTGEAATLNNIAGVYYALGERQKALEYYEQALPLERALRDRPREAGILNNIGQVYSDLGERQKALEYFNQALPLRRAVGDRAGEAMTLNNIGGVYFALGERQQALEYYNQALPVRRAVGDRTGEARTLNNIGGVYDALGEKQKALQYYQEAVPLERALGDRAGEARTLNNIGQLYSDLGERQKALEYFNQALPLERALGDRAGEATTLNNIGQVYSDLGERQKALEYFNQALPLERGVGDRAGEAMTLNNIGLVYAGLGEKQKALEYFSQALPVERAVGDREREARTLNNIAVVYCALGERKKALEYYEQALPIERAVGDRGGEAVTLSSLRELWEQQYNPPLAIFFGKQAVNVYQSLRRDIQGLDKDIQKTYVGTITGAYRSLADLLLAEGRLPEAEQVLGMLKEQEFKEFTRGETVSPTNTVASLTTKEKRGESILAQALEWQVLDQKPNRTGEQEARYKELDKALTANNVNLSNFWESLQSILPPEETQNKEMNASAAQKLLHDLPAGTVVVYTLLLEDKLDLIVVHQEAMAQKSIAVKRTELADAVEQFRAAIRDRKQGEALLGPAHRLYDWIVAPIAAELEGAHTPTIAWSLDGVLRYMPVNALYDGHRFLIERYTNVIYTPADTTGLEKKPEITSWKALGMGVSKQYLGELNPLPSVPGELRTIVHDQQDRDSHGPMAGRILLDDSFTERALEQQLRQRYPIVHIASHFVMGLGTDESYLLLGGEDEGGHGYRLRLSALKTKTRLKFDDTALLTLSACQTAMSSKEADGKEVDSLATIGRQRGAQAVLASLWDVNDASTGRLMADFYRRWTSTGSLSKADALRQAQLALLQGTGSGPGSAGNVGRGAEPATAPGDAHAPDASIYSHPYYWAPFILMGNWQ